MNPNQWSRLREIFFTVCQAPAEDRETILASLCDGNAELAAGVRELLAADDESVGGDDERGAFLDQPALGRVLTEVALTEVGEQSLTLEQVGPYLIVRKLGEGGMGTVFEAVQEHPRRNVAVKVLRPGASSPQALKRFRQEADLLAQLQHPGIAQIYDAGVADVKCKGQVIGRQPYFALELVRGTTITEYCRERKPHPRDIMTLMSLVADAVQHAHQNGVIHRDLKPGNILVDESGEPKVLDFGVARPMNALQTRASLHTHTGQIVGTLAYMSPEQTSGDSAQVDTRSDVYSLGVVLYELLAGRPPHNVRGIPLTDAIRLIRDRSVEDLERVRPELRGDVSRIVAKAMAKERERRYQSAGALAEDIRRYLADQPVLARPTSAIYQLRKFARRNKALVGGAAATLASLLIGMAGIVWFAIGESRARTDAESASKTARRLAYRVSIAAAGDAIQLSSYGQARRLLHEVPTEERQWEWRYLANQLDDSFLSLLERNRLITHLRFSADARELMAESDGLPVRWNLQTGAITRLFNGIDRLAAVSLDFTHAVTIGDLGNIQRINLQTGQAKQWDGDGVRYNVVALSPDGLRIALGGVDGRFRVLSERTDAKPFSSKFATAVRALHFAPTGPRLAIQTTEQSIVVDSDSGQTLGTMQIEASNLPNLDEWLHDGSRLFLHCMGPHVRDLYVRPFQVEPPTPTEPLRGLSESLTAMIVSPDDRFVLGCQSDGKIHMWNLESGARVRTFQCASSGTQCIAIHPNGGMFVVGDTSGVVRAFDVESGNEIGVLRGLTTNVSSLAFSTDGSLVAAGTIDGVVRLWRSDVVRSPSVLRGHSSYVYPVAFSPDGSRVASGSWDRTIRLWDTATGQETNILSGHATELLWLSFSPDGRRLLSLSGALGTTQNVMIWDVQTGRSIARMAQPMQDIARPVFCSPANRVWLSSLENGAAQIWDWEKNIVTSESLSALQGTTSPWISKDQQTLARFTGDEHRLELVDMATGQVRHSLCAHATRVSFSPDNRMVAGLSRPPNATGDVVGIWLVQTGRRLGELRHEGGEIYDVGFSPDGTRIFTCGRDKLIHLWDARTLEGTIGLRGHADYVWSVAWSPDGETLASGSGDQTVRLWSSKPTSRGGAGAASTAANEKQDTSN